MATELTVQSERAFQKQPHIFLNHKGKQAKSKKLKGKGGRRWYKVRLSWMSFLDPMIPLDVDRQTRSHYLCHQFPVCLDADFAQQEVGLGFRTPKTAIEGHYIGEAPPFSHHQVSISNFLDSRQKMPLYGGSQYSYVQCTPDLNTD